MKDAVEPGGGRPGNIVDCLSRSKLFSGLGADEIERIFPLLKARIRQHKKGAVIVSVDGVVNDIGIVLRGRLNVSKEDVYGNLNLIRDTVPYEMFAAEIACTPSRISPIVISCTTDAEVLTFSYHRIAAESDMPERFRCLLLKNIAEIIANTNMRQLYKIDILSKRSLRDRVILYLVNQARRTPGILMLPFNREELACYLCVDRSALSRELSRMQRDGLIRFNKNEFLITGNLIG